MHFVYVRIAGIVKDMMFSNFRAANSLATSLRCIRAGKMLITHEDVHSLTMNMSREGLATRNQGITRLNDPSFYNSS